MKKLITPIIFLLSMGISFAQEITDRYCLDNTTLVTVYTSHWVVNHRNYDINQTEYTHCEFGCYDDPNGNSYCLPNPNKQKAYAFFAIAGVSFILYLLARWFGG